MWYFTVLCLFLPSLKNKGEVASFSIDSTHKALHIRLFLPVDTYSTNAWSLPSTSSTSCSPSSSSSSSQYLDALFDTRSLCTLLCPVHALLAPLLANRQLLMEAEGVTNWAPDLYRRERSRRGRAMLTDGVSSLFEPVLFTCFAKENAQVNWYNWYYVDTTQTVRYFTMDVFPSPCLVTCIYMLKCPETRRCTSATITFKT